MQPILVIENLHKKHPNGSSTPLFEQISLNVLPKDRIMILGPSGQGKSRTIGSSMIVCGLFLNQMNREVASSREEIEALLALGSTLRQAIQQALQRSVKASILSMLCYKLWFTREMTLK